MYKRTDFKVIPGLSLKGKDIRQRLRNGTIAPKPAQYGEGFQDALHEFMQKDKPGRLAAMAENAEQIKLTKSKLSKQ